MSELEIFIKTAKKFKLTKTAKENLKNIEKTHKEKIAEGKQTKDMLWKNITRNLENCNFLIWV